MRCLSIYVGHEIKKNFNSNWNSKIDRIKVILTRWKASDLYLFGKVHVIKTFAVSQFVLPASLLSVPPEVIKQIESVLYDFLWGPRDKIKRIKVVQELKCGGLNMVDVKCLLCPSKQYG